MDKPSTGRQIGASIGLVLIDLLVIAYFLYGYGVTGWADSYDDNNAADAPGAARHAMWILTWGAAITGGGLYALRLRVAGTVQLLVLGGAAAAFALLAVK